MIRTTLASSLLVFVAIASFAPMLARAEDAKSALTVTPVVVDEKAKARDILKETVTLTNTSDHQIDIYPSVNDVQASEGQQPFAAAQNGAERSDSLANWIEISRGMIELKPNETKEVPFIIRVNLNALPGTYHADISFYQGSTRAEAEASRPLAVVTVNTEVQAEIKEAMQLNKFVTDSFFFSGDDILFNYQVQNIGNQELKPKGEIRVYDRKGHEVASIPVNGDSQAITPDQVAQLASAWTGAHGFGKFKAFLNIDYGAQGKSLQDTVFFWIIPWQQLLAIVVVSFIAILVSALYFHRWLEHKHMQRFAAAHGVAAMGGTAAIAPVPGMIVPPKQKPVAVVMPEPVITEKPKKKGFFSRFRRAKKTEEAIPAAPAATPVTAAAPAPVAAPEPVSTVHTIPVIDETPAPAVQQRAPERGSATIDLSGTPMHSTGVRQSAGHVINLKNGI